MKLPFGEILTVIVIVALGLANLALYTGVLDGFDPVHAGRSPRLPSGIDSGASTPEGTAPPKFKIMVFNLSGNGLDFDDFGPAAKAAAKAIKKDGGPDITVLAA